MADFGMSYDQVDKELTIYGSGAPSEANYAKLYVRTADGNSIESGIGIEVEEDGTFEYTFDVSDWKYEGMNINVRFYEDREWRWSFFRGW